MSNQVYANNMEVSCKSAAGKSICAFPDVCFTPPLTPATPPGVPIPYPNTGMASDCTDGSSTVKVSGQEVMLKNKSYFKRSTGDEAGCAPKKGIINSKVSGKVYFTAWSMNIMIEGENVVRNLDLTTGNHGSTPPNEGIPWAYLDEMAVSSPEDQACKDQVEEFKKACEPAVKVKKDNSLNVAGTGKAMCEDKKCAEKRECILLPFNLGCCPSSTGKDRTAHHLIPNSLIQGVRADSSTNIPGIKSTYTDAIAPCCCVTGASHH